jgi:DNA-binding transcriptional regulator YiaG
MIEKTQDEVEGRAEQLTLPIVTPEVTWAEAVARDELAELRKQLDLVTPDEVARLLGVAEQTLAGWRCNGEGPHYVKLGKGVFYRREHLKAWIEKSAHEPVAD